MTKRRASATAVLVCQGRACANGRYAADLFADPVAGQLLDPAELAVVSGVREGQVPPTSERSAYEMVRRCAVTIVPRTIAIDHAICEQAAAQVVILGAGLDARAWRMPELGEATVFEVDHRTSQRDKLRRVGHLRPTASRVIPVEVDLTSQRLGPALHSAGFDPEAATTWVWEGVVPYLRPGAVRATVVQVAELSTPGHRLVVNYQAKSLTVTVLRMLVRPPLRVSRHRDPLAAEPWRSQWRPDQMGTLLGDAGYAVVSDHDLLSLSEGFELPSDNVTSLRNGRVAVADYS